MRTRGERSCEYSRQAAHAFARKPQALPAETSQRNGRRLPGPPHPPARLAPKTCAKFARVLRGGAAPPATGGDGPAGVCQRTTPTRQDDRRGASPRSQPQAGERVDQKGRQPRHHCGEQTATPRSSMAWQQPSLVVLAAAWPASHPNLPRCSAARPVQPPEELAPRLRQRHPTHLMHSRRGWPDQVHCILWRQRDPNHRHRRRQGTKQELHKHPTRLHCPTSRREKAKGMNPESERVERKRANPKASNRCSKRTNLKVRF